MIDQRALRETEVSLIYAKLPKHFTTSLKALRPLCADCDLAIIASYRKVHDKPGIAQENSTAAWNFFVDEFVDSLAKGLWKSLELPLLRCDLAGG